MEATTPGLRADRGPAGPGGTPPVRDTVGGRPIVPDAPLLRVEDLHVEFRTRSGVVRAVNGVAYELHERETVAILGESGSGKTVSAEAVLGLIESPPGFVTRGRVLLKGVDLFTLTPEELRTVRANRIAMVFQEALGALNPAFTVGWQIGELFRRHRGTSRREAKARAIELMDRVRIPSARERVEAYPHEFSGGMRQRVMIAMALALDPDVLIADEPTTALDVTVQAQIMRLLADLQQETGMGLVLVTHDLGVVADVADRVEVMYAGRIVERGTVREVYRHPAHPYTVGLMRSIPRADLKGQRLQPVPGAPPDPVRLPSGCAFRPRCSYARERCADEVPSLRELAVPTRSCACHYSGEVALEQG